MHFHSKKIAVKAYICSKHACSLSVKAKNGVTMHTSKAFHVCRYLKRIGLIVPKKPTHQNIARLPLSIRNLRRYSEIQHFYNGKSVRPAWPRRRGCPAPIDSASGTQRARAAGAA
jgi:hypothetical protein